jgi:hypothetical protein
LYSGGFGGSCQNCRFDYSTLHCSCSDGSQFVDTAVDLGMFEFLYTFSTVSTSQIPWCLFMYILEISANMWVERHRELRWELQWLLRLPVLRIRSLGEGKEAGRLDHSILLSTAE